MIRHPRDISMKYFNILQTYCAISPYANVSLKLVIRTDSHVLA